MSADAYLEIPADQTAKISLKNGHLILYYDDEKDQVIIQATSRGVLHVLPRATNSVALKLPSD
jgi:hypothetical protein